MSEISGTRTEKDLTQRSLRLEHRVRGGFGALTSTAFTSQSPKQEVPDRINQCMHDRRSEDRPRPAPSPPIKQSGNRRQNHVAPIWETHVGDVREAEQHRSRPPARHLALRRSRQQILQQPAEQKLLRPSRETQNRQGQEGKRLPLRPTWRKLYKMNDGAEWNGDRGEHPKLPPM